MNNTETFDYHKQMAEKAMNQIAHAIDELSINPISWSSTGQIRIYIPAFLLQWIRESLPGFKGWSKPKAGEVNWMFGKEVVVGYEMAIIVAHEDCVTRNDSSLVIRIPLL